MFVYYGYIFLNLLTEIQYSGSTDFTFVINLITPRKFCWVEWKPSDRVISKNNWQTETCAKKSEKTCSKTDFVIMTRWVFGARYSIKNVIQLDELCFRIFLLSGAFYNFLRLELNIDINPKDCQSFKCNIILI